jgi:hypothetical protein
VLGRVNPIESAPKYGNGTTTGGKRGVVRHSINSTCETAHDDNPRSGETTCYLLRRLTPIRGRTARAHDCYGRFIVARKLAFGEQYGWSVWHAFQERGICGVDHSDQFNAGCPNSIPELFWIALFPQLDQSITSTSIQTSVNERASISVPSGSSVTEHVDKPPQPRGTDAFHLGEQCPKNAVIQGVGVPEPRNQFGPLRENERFIGMGHATVGREESLGSGAEVEAMYSILYIIGAIVVIYVVLRVLGIA